MKIALFLVLLIGVLFSGLETTAQNLKKPAKRIQEGEFLKARNEAMSLLPKAQEKAGIYYLVAQSFFSSTPVLLDSSLFYLKLSKGLYPKVSQARKDQLALWGITNTEIAALEYKLDSTFFEQAKSTQTEIGFQDYLSKWPDGMGGVYANQQIQNFQFEFVSKYKTTANLENYVAKYPSTPAALQCKNWIDSIQYEAMSRGKSPFEILQKGKFSSGHPYLTKLLPRVLQECRARGNDSLWIFAARAYQDMPASFEMWTMAMAFSGMALKPELFFDKYPDASPKEELKKWFMPYILIQDSVGAHCISKKGEIISHLPIELPDEEPVLLELPCAIDAVKKCVVNRKGQTVLPFLPAIMKSMAGVGGENYMLYTNRDSSGTSKLGLVDAFGTKILNCQYENVIIKTPYLLATTSAGTGLYALNGIKIVGDSMKAYHIHQDTLYFETQDSSYRLPLESLLKAAINGQKLPALASLLMPEKQDSTQGRNPILATNPNYRTETAANKSLSLFNAKNELVIADIQAALPKNSNELALLKAGKFGLYDINSGNIIPPIFDEIPINYRGNSSLYITKKNDKYGLTSDDGTELTGHRFKKLKAWNKLNALCETDSGTQFLSLTTYKVTGSVFKGYKSYTIGAIEIMTFNLRGKYMAISSNSGTIIPSRHQALSILKGTNQEFILGIDVRDNGTQIVTAYNLKGTVLYSKELSARKP